jgi:anti-sigma B factor antagonist
LQERVGKTRKKPLIRSVFVLPERPDCGTPLALIYGGQTRRSAPDRPSNKAEYRAGIVTVRASTRNNGGIGIIEIRSSLVGDGDTEELKATAGDFLEQGIRHVVIDLRRVNYLNSTGIGSIIATHTTFRKNGGDVRLTGLSDNVQSLLVITRLIDVFDVYDTLDEAIASFNVNGNK